MCFLCPEQPHLWSQGDAPLPAPGLGVLQLGLLSAALGFLSPASSPERLFGIPGLIQDGFFLLLCLLGAATGATPNKGDLPEKGSARMVHRLERNGDEKGKSLVPT